VNVLNWSTGFFGGGVILTAIVLMASHLHGRRAIAGEDFEPVEADYRRRQFRRRVQASGMLALVGVAILAAGWVPRTPRWYAGYWSVVLLLTLWVAILAAADAVATYTYMSRVRRMRINEETRWLEDELQQARAKGQNGRAAKAGGDVPHPDSPS